MGCFGWIDCNADPKRTAKPNNIVSGNRENFYVLLPEDIKDKILNEFPRTKSYYNEANNSLKDSGYDGYGNMGGVDVYELIAFMNVRCSDKSIDELISYLHQPHLEEYGGLGRYEIEDLKAQGKTDKEIEVLNKAEKEKFYNRALRWYEEKKARLIEYKETGKCATKDDLREIGIDIGCYDKQMARLPYQFKVTYDKNARYEDCKFSPSDPCQSWGRIKRGELIETLRDRDKAIKEAEKKYINYRPATFEEILKPHTFNETGNNEYGWCVRVYADCPSGIIDLVKGAETHNYGVGFTKMGCNSPLQAMKEGLDYANEYIENEGFGWSYVEAGKTGFMDVYDKDGNKAFNLSLEKIRGKELSTPDLSEDEPEMDR